MTRLVHLPSDFRIACDEARSKGARVGFVPTMGALHEGHLSLVEEAKRRADFVAVSIFVNPLQFGPSEDLDRYPRTLDADMALLAGRGVDLVFAPTPSSMYPSGFDTRVEVGALTESLDGMFRPGHFRGVTTVVAKLFGLVGASA
ncbi:MAG: pantoate--beta-alanine ligase, partial [Polyangiaceae bacterium]|nr:pantoate--beta-alanine ligase [Polyangiaceae bacterium]